MAECQSRKEVVNNMTKNINSHDLPPPIITFIELVIQSNGEKGDCQRKEQSNLFFIIFEMHMLILKE